MKIGRDKQVKWILAPSKGWEKPLASKLLKPVDANGGQLPVTKMACAKTQTSTLPAPSIPPGFPAKERSPFLIMAMGRHLEQPALPTMKYSRFCGI